MSGLTREETAGPVFRGENLRRERGREKTKHIFSFRVTTNGGIENYAGHYTSTCPRRPIGVLVDKLTVPLLFAMMWIREFHSWPGVLLWVP